MVSASRSPFSCDKRLILPVAIAESFETVIVHSARQSVSFLSACEVIMRTTGNTVRLTSCWSRLEQPGRAWCSHRRQDGNSTRTAREIRHSIQSRVSPKSVPADPIAVGRPPVRPPCNPFRAACALSLQHLFWKQVTSNVYFPAPADFHEPISAMVSFGRCSIEIA